jgi:hypothetical protein
MEVFDNKILNTNSQGFRGKEEYKIEKNPNKKRVIFIGDSFTFGEEVSDKETYPYYFGKLLPNIEVINLGVHGYGHDQMLISLREQGQLYKPDFVILGFIEADTKRNMVNFRDYAKPQFELNENELTLTSVPVPTPEHTLKWDWARPRIVDIFSIIKHQIREKSGEYEKEKAKLAKAILKEIANECNRIGAIPIFLYIPLITEIHSDEFMVYGEKFLQEICEENNVLYFSTRPYLMNKGKKGTEYKDKGHWGSDGNLAIAEAIKQFMIESEQISLKNKKSDLIEDENI